MSGTRARLLKGSAWITGARVLSNLLGLVGMIILARLLAPADFGLVAFGTTLFMIFASITAVAVSEALVQHREPTVEHLNTAWTISILRAALLSLLFAAAAWPCARLFHDSRLIGVMLTLSATSFLGGFGNPRAIMLTKELVFWQQFMLQAVQSVASLVVSVAVGVIYHSYWALLLGGLAGQVLNVAASYTVLPFRPAFCLRHSRELLSFSIWLTLCQIVSTINWRLDQLVIALFNGRAALGYYTVGDSLAVLPSREAVTPLTSTLFPAFANLTGERQRLSMAYQSAQALVTAIALPVGTGVALLADPLVRLTLGPRWLQAVFVIQMLAWVYAFQTLGNLAQPLAMAAGETKLLFKRDWQGLILRAPLIVLGACLGGIHGILYARAAIGTVGILLNTSIVTRITGLTFAAQMGVNFRSVLSTLIMAAAVAGNSLLLPASFGFWPCIIEIAVLGSVGAFVYVSCSLILWVAMDRPSGPETEILSVAGKFKNLLVRRQPPLSAAG